MKKIKVFLSFGTRPEAIKMAPLVLELKNNAFFDVIVCVTGQHKKMLQQVLDTFNIKPDYNLEIMKKNQTLFDVTSNILTGIQSILEKEKPDMILVHGDTTTTFATALAAFYLHIPVGHVEAGLRTYNIYSPFPEEYNRQSVGLISTLHFAPTEKAKMQLIAEQKDPRNIFVTGNTGIDALHTTISADYQHPLLSWLGNDRLILVTAHRRENLGEPMKQMFRAIHTIAKENPDIKILYPVHLNPQVQEIAQSILGSLSNIRLVEPLEVIDFHNIMNRATIILTDSGGIQEEAPSLGKPVLVMRDTTERPEGVEAGTLKLVGTNFETIYQTTKRLLQDNDFYQSMSHAKNPYGDGTASQQIAEIIKNYFCNQ